MTASLMPEARQRYYTNIGLPLALGKVYTYAAGTSTPKATYQDAAGTIPHANPIVLDAKGEALIYWSGAYKVDVKTALGGTVTGYPVDNYISSITPADLSVTSGAGLVGFLYSATYAVGTIGRWLKDLATSAGSSLIGFIQAGAGAVLRTVRDELRDRISVKQFGAIGDGVVDDRAAIQAALDYAESTGGGTVYLNKTAGKYRITAGLKLPSYVTLEGIAPDRYPFNSSTTASCLLLDFVDVNQWAIEPKTTKNGIAVPYNDIIHTTDTFAYTFNCGVKNLRMEAVNTIPYGAIRMHGCPGSVVDNVSVTGTGAGLLVNQCYGGKYVMHCLTKYYGTLAWEDVNACNFDVYNSGIQPETLVVPAGYLMSFMATFNGTLIGTFKLNTNAHYNRSWGMIIGGNPSTSSGNRLKMTCERYSGGCFQSQAYGTVFDLFYVESAINVMSFACVAIVSRFVINGLHAYMGNTGKVFDLGITVYARITAIGLVDYPNYGYGPYLDSSSLVTIDGMAAQDFGPATPQFNLVHTSGSKGFVAPTLTNSWVDYGVGWECGYRLNSRTGNVELRGRIKNGLVDNAAFTLPAGYRSIAANLFAGAGGQILITSAGAVIPTALSGTDIALDGMSFYAEQ